MNLYPKPFNVGYLPEFEGHQIYFEEYGNGSGKSIIVCHGGPGSKSKSSQVSSFNLSLYHVILFDQRGCGKSLPQGELKNNTTAHLISDMERLRVQMKIDRWYVAGGSWGSTLALAYAESHPDKVIGLLLSSIFLGRREDVDWLFTKDGGINKIFTDLWQERTKFLTKFSATPSTYAKVLLKKIEESNPEVVSELVAGVINWERNLISSQSDLSFINPADIEVADINEVKVFLHYDAHDFFLTENQLLDNINAIKNIPAMIVHGRYDLLCPLNQMWALAQALPKSEYVILPTSNHKLTADGEIARKYAYQYFLTKVVK